MKAELIVHPLDPVFDAESRILILGTMPSPKSREAGFYYAHPRNRFRKVLGALFGRELSDTAAMTSLLHEKHIALWDVIHSCEIRGASDSSIKNIVPNDISRVTEASRVHAVFTTGTTAFKLYNRYCRSSVGIEAIPLPSTSPANAKKSLAELTEDYRIILDYLDR